MTQEDRKLLLKDLCARLPYHVMVLLKDGSTEPLINVNIDTLICNGLEDLPEPYLRPLSSLNEAEQVELGKLVGTASFYMLKGDFESLRRMLEHVYSKHIDLFGLIDKGLALEAPAELKKEVSNG